MANAIRIKRVIWGRDETSMSNLKRQSRSVIPVTDVFNLGMCVVPYNVSTYNVLCSVRSLVFSSFF
jgi:hypothetical protein